MRIDVISIFPALVRGVLTESLIGKAIDAGTLDVRVHDLRDWTTDRHRSVDDESFGGGPGVGLKPEPLFAAGGSLEPARGRLCGAWEAREPGRGRVLGMSPAGRLLDQALVADLATEVHVTILCGRY